MSDIVDFPLGSKSTNQSKKGEIMKTKRKYLKPQLEFVRVNLNNNIAQMSGNLDVPNNKMTIYKTHKIGLGNLGSGKDDANGVNSGTWDSNF